jgi:hypothetical protein
VDDEEQEMLSEQPPDGESTEGSQLGCSQSTHPGNKMSHYSTHSDLTGSD